MSDNNTVQRAQAKLMRCALDLEGMAEEVADARQVREFSHDRCKRALSASVAPLLEEGESGVAAEHKARASAVYGSALHDLELQYRDAMRVIERYEAIKTVFEATRSVLSVERAKIGLL